MIIIANTIGAVSGMGGGVIIKPILDAIGLHDVSSVSFYSSVAVLLMAITSTYKQVNNGIKLNWKIVFWISIGSSLGGVLGNIIFQFLLVKLDNSNHVLLLQIFLTIITLLFSFISIRYDLKHYNFNNIFMFFLCGIVLGFLASLLGIGGGPINVSLLVILFNMSIKDATVYSISIILFSQLAKVGTIALTTGFHEFDLSVLFYIIPAAMLGGVFGAYISKQITPTKVTLIFQGVILLIICVNIMNGIKII